MGLIYEVKNVHFKDQLLYKSIFNITPNKLGSSNGFQLAQLIKSLIVE